MIAFLRRLFRSRLQRLVERASRHGRITLAQVDLEHGLGWSCAIRPEYVAASPKAHRYTWSGTGRTMEEAISVAVAEADETPMKKIEGARYAPRLTSKEFDE